ncbi:MAG: hypothetical protein IPM61_13895 [Chlorobi bacterium]|nr:hypothetical protein [Chlorobiota bacterium]MBX7217738.1 hypothetical protein [Candidatus Kapabacteria bacterium]
MKNFTKPGPGRFWMPALASWRGVVCGLLLLGLIAAGCSNPDTPPGTTQGEEGENPFLRAAETVALQIPDTVARQTAQSTIATSYAEAGLFADANRMMQGLRLPEIQSYLIAKIATEQSRKGHDSIARTMLAAAASLDLSALTPSTRVVRTGELARAALRLGDTAAAKRFLDDGRVSAISIADPFFRTRAVAELAIIYAEAGFRNDASAMLEQAAKGIDGKKMPGSLALGYISRAFGEIGRPATALATAAASPERRVQFDGLLNAAASYAKLGSTDSAVALLNKAAEVAASESEWHSRAPGWVAVAKQLAGIKEWKPAMEVLKKLQEGSNTLAPAAQFDAAVGIAECLVALRLSSQADSASAQVIRFSQGMSDPNVLGVVAATITAAAEAYIDSGMTASGIRLLDHAATVAGSSPAGAERESLLAQISYDQARAGNFTGAIAAYQQLAQPRERALALASIGTEYAKAGRKPSAQELKILEAINNNNQRQ